MFDAYLAPIHAARHRLRQHSGKRSASERLEGCVRKSSGRTATASSVPRVRRRIERMKDENVDYLTGAHDAGKRIFGFGAR